MQEAMLNSLCVFLSVSRMSNLATTPTVLKLLFSISRINNQKNMRKEQNLRDTPGNFIHVINLEVENFSIYKG